MGYMLDVVFEAGEKGEGNADVSSCLQEALKEVELARARANHAEEEMSRCREAAMKVKGNLRRMAIVRPFCEPDKENSNWMQVLGPRELQVQAQEVEKAQTRRRMSTGCIPDSIQKRCNISPRIMDFEHILGHEDNRIFQVLKPDIEACVAGEATEVLCAFICGAASYHDKASFADRLAAKVVALLETAAATDTAAKVQMQMFEIHGDQHRDLLDVNSSFPQGRRPSAVGLKAPLVSLQLHPNMEEPMTNSFKMLIREARSWQTQKFFAVSHFVTSFRICRPSKSVGHIVIVDVDSSDRGWTCKSSQTYLWHLLGGFQEHPSPTMLLMLDPAPGAQADTLKTLQFGQRLQSSLLRFGPRQNEFVDDAWHQAVAREVAGPLRDELARLQKETSQVLDEVQAMKRQIEKKDSEIAELRRCSSRMRIMKSPTPCRLQAPAAGPKLQKAQPLVESWSSSNKSHCQPAGSKSIPGSGRAMRPWRQAHSIRDDSSPVGPASRLCPSSTKVAAPSGLRLRLASKPGVRSRDWQQRSNQERTIPSRLGRPAQAMERARLSPTKEEQCIRLERFDRPRSTRPAQRSQLSALPKHATSVRISPPRLGHQPFLPIRAGGCRASVAGTSGSRMKDAPNVHHTPVPKDAKALLPQAPALPDSSLTPSSPSSSSSSNSGLRCGSLSHRVQAPSNRPNSRIQDLLPLRLDLTRVFKDVATGCFHEGVSTPQTPRGRPPIAWWNSAEETAPASARGRAPSNCAGEDLLQRRARSLYVVDVMSPRTALSFMPRSQDDDALSPVTVLRPLCPEAAWRCPAEGIRAGRQSFGNISVSSDEDDIRTRLSQELCHKSEKQNDVDNSEQDGHAEGTAEICEGEKTGIQETEASLTGSCDPAHSENSMYSGKDN